MFHFWSILYYVIPYQTEMGGGLRMSVTFGIILFGFALSDVTLIWLCSEWHVRELRIPHSEYHELDWYSRLQWLCARDVYIAVSAYSIPGFLMTGCMAVAVTPFAA
jgi:hypothetical protein